MQDCSTLNARSLLSEVVFMLNINMQLERGQFKRCWGSAEGSFSICELLLAGAYQTALVEPIKNRTEWL